MIEIIGSLLTILSIVGVILNAKGKIAGFYFWIPANIGWIAVDLHKGVYSQALLFAFYLLACFYGVYCWKKKRIVK